MHTIEQDPFARQAQQHELDPAMLEMYAQMAQREAVQPVVEAEPAFSAEELEQQAKLQAQQVESKRHLVEDAFSAAEVHVPAGEKMVLDGQTKKATEQVMITEAAKSQPVPDEGSQGRKRLLHKMGSHVKDRAQKLGIKSKISGRQHEQDALMRLRAGSEADIATQAGGARELDVTQASRQEWVEDKVVGEQLIQSLASPQRMTPEMRQKMRELWKEDPSKAKEIWQGVSYYQSTGSINRRTAHATGEATRKLGA